MKKKFTPLQKLVLELDPIYDKMNAKCDAIMTSVTEKGSVSQDELDCCLSSCNDVIRFCNEHPALNTALPDTLRTVEAVRRCMAACKCCVEPVES